MKREKMLFFIIVAVVFLPYQFIPQVFSLHEKSHDVIENFQGLFDAVARNKSKTLAKFVGRLTESKKRLEEEFDDIKSSFSNHHEHHYQSIHTRCNITTKREAKEELKVFNRQKELTELEVVLAKLDTTKKIEFLKSKVLNEKEENSRLVGIVANIGLHKAILSIPLQKLKLRSIIEDIVRVRYPNGKPAKMSFMDALNELLVSNAIRFTERPDIMGLRQMIAASKLGIKRFLELVKILYSKWSNQGGHNLEGYDIVQLPTNLDEIEIKMILESTVVPVHEDYITTVQLLLKPLPIPPKQPAIPLEEFSCIRIEAQSPAEEKRLSKVKENIRDEDIRLVFPRSIGDDDKPQKIDRIYIPKDNDKGSSQYVILVHFNEVKHARKAFDHNTGYLKDVLISVHLVPCNGLSTTTLSTTILSKTTTTSIAQNSHQKPNHHQ